jgi:tetratricopeptide (TPR) repeat protein
MYKQVIIGVLCLLLAVMTVIAAYQHNTLKRMKVRLESAEARLGSSVSDSFAAGRSNADTVHSALSAETSTGRTSDEESLSGAVSETGAAPDGTQEKSAADRQLALNSQPGSDGSQANTAGAEANVSAPGAVSQGTQQGTGGKDDRSTSKQDKKQKEASSNEAQQSNALLQQAQQRIQDGDYETAQALLQQSVEQDTRNSKAWKQMAQLQRQLGMTDSEIGTYQQWMDSVPEDNEPYYMAAEAYARVGMDAEAREYLAAYESMAQGTTGDYVRMSHLYRSLNDREDEGRILAQWTETAPESMDARHAWADYQRRMGNYGEALAQYESMAAMTPDNPLPYRQMAEIYRRNGDYVQAQQQYETALAVRPGDISTMNRLADVRYTAGDLNGALNVYAEIMALEPGSRAAEQAERRATQIQLQLQQYAP